MLELRELGHAGQRAQWLPLKLMYALGVRDISLVEKIRSIGSVVVAKRFDDRGLPGSAESGLVNRTASRDQSRSPRAAVKTFCNRRCATVVLRCIRPG